LSFFELLPVVLFEPGFGGWWFVAGICLADLACFGGFGVCGLLAQLVHVLGHAIDFGGASFFGRLVGGREEAEWWAWGEEGEEVWGEFVGHLCWVMYFSTGMVSLSVRAFVPAVLGQLA
jgi:hypothetical protein